MEPKEKDNAHLFNNKLSIRNIYKQKKLEEEKEDKNNRRINDKEFDIRFSNLKKDGNKSISELNDLLKHNNLNIIFLDYYCEILYKYDRNKLKNEMLLFYPFMPPNICQKYHIKKEKSEKEKFFELYNKIITSDFSKIDKIIADEYKFPKELPNYNFTTKEKRDINRWNLDGTKKIDFNNIYNEEYFYYILSKYILSNFKDSTYMSQKRGYYYNLLSLATLVLESDFYAKENPNLFEYVFLFLLSSQKTNNFIEINKISLYDAFISSMKRESKKKENNPLTDEGIVAGFKKVGIKASIKKNNLIIIINNIKKEIKDYKNYFINAHLIFGIADGFIYNLEKKSLSEYLKFEYLKNPKNYFDGLLYEIIGKYVSSNLSKTSLSKCFNINLDEYYIIEYEICTKNIHKYIRLIPYCSDDDTGRTLKQFAKILIDPSKQIMIYNIISRTKNYLLKEYLEKFINIVYRKYIFEHEHNNLCNYLLYFYYIDKDYENKKQCLEKSGEIFEALAYGTNTEYFKLKQLLFIANEKNDELSVDKYKKSYIEVMNKEINAEQLFKVFRDNKLILSNLVNQIYFEIKKELSTEKNKGKTLDDYIDEIIACKNELYKGSKNGIKSLEEFCEMIMVEDIGHYDCHIEDKRKRMKFNEDI